MQLEAFRQWTERLYESLSYDQRVIGLVMLGSSAERQRIPDEWSDHDFFVITRPGEQESMRVALDWLPDADQIVLKVRETDHGLKVIYADTHVIEFAIFDMAEIFLARVNDYRVLIDTEEGRVSAALRELEGRSAAVQFDREKEMGMMLSLIVIGVGRAARGEIISGGRFIKDFALAAYLRLLAHDQPAAVGSTPDNLDPFRRVEETHPAVAPKIHALLLLPPMESSAALLDLAETTLRDVPPDAVNAVRETVQKATQT